MAMGPHMRISWWAKSTVMHFAVVQMPTSGTSCSAMCGAVETKMAAGWEYDELANSRT
jgi:hypothetical protein